MEETWQRSVARILPVGSPPTSGPKGTGFVVTIPRGRGSKAEAVVVTCAHVVLACRPDGVSARPSRVQVVFDETGDAREATVDAAGWRPGDAGDIAILRIVGAPLDGIDGLPLGPSAVSGGEFHTLGYPNQSPIAVAGAGTITKVFPGRSSVYAIQLSSEDVTTGYSGAPIWHVGMRRVIGMVARIIGPDAHNRSGNIAYATPAELILDACPELRISETCPYRGLEPFTDDEDVARFFFGREEQVSRIVDRLEQKPAVIAVFGPSGSGKSSLVQAGVIPRLRVDGWLVPPTVRHYDDVEKVLEPLEASPTSEHTLIVLDQFEEALPTAESGKDSSQEPVGAECKRELLRKLAGFGDRPATTIMIVMRNDFYSQFVKETPAELRDPALANLVEVPAQLTRDDLMDIIVNPAEMVGLSLEPGLADRIADDALEAAGAQGNASYGVILPLLEFALTQLWKERDPPYLTLAGYRKVGEVNDGLTRWADDALRELSSGPVNLEPVVRQVMVALVRFGDIASGEPDSRKTVTVDKLKEDIDAPGVEEVVRALEHKRLLIPEGGRDGSPRRVQLAHDTLIRRWKRLRDWVSADRAFELWEQAMLPRATKWKAGAGALLSDFELAEAERKLEERSGKLEDPLPEWIAASIAADRAARKRLSRLIRGVTVAALLFLGASILALTLYFRAEHQATLNRVQSIAAQSRLSQAAGDDEQAALLALEAWRLDEDREFSGPVGTALQGSIGAPSFSTLSSDHPSEVQYIAYSGDGRTMAVIRDNGGLEVLTPNGHVSCDAPPGEDGSAQLVRANRAALNEDGSLLALGSRDSFVHLWRLDGASCNFEHSLAGPGGQVAAIALATDGDTQIVAMGSCRTRTMKPTTSFSARAEECAPGGARVRVWRLMEKPTLAADYPIDGKYVCALAIDPERGWLAASGCGNGSSNTPVCGPEAGAIALWPLDGVAETPRCLTGHRGDVRTLTRCKGMLASGGTDRVIRLWEVETQTVTRTLIGHSEAVRGLAFTRDCTFLGSASEDGDVGLWYLAEDNPILDVVGSSTQWVRTVAFGGADGLDLSAEAPGGRVRTWHLGGMGSVPGNLYGHENYIRALAFSPQPGTLLLASSAEDGTLRLWDLKRPWAPPVLPGFGDRPPATEIATVAFSHDGRFIAAADNGGRIWIWDVAAPDRPLDSLRLEQKEEVTLAFHPREDQLVAGTRSGELILWEIQGPGSPSLVRIGGKLTIDPDVAITALAFRPSGDALAAGDENGTITIRAWRPDGLAEAPWYRLDGGDRIHALVYSPDGSLLASGGNDEMVRVWDTQARYRLVQALPGHENEVRSLAFSPEGDTLASGSVDQTIRLWSTEHLDAAPVIIFGLSEWVRALAISPDGEVLAAAATDGRIRLLIPDSDTLAAGVCDRVSRNLSEEEWIELVGSDPPYRASCPGIELGEPSPTSAVG